LTGELPTESFVPPSKKTPVDPRVDDVVQRTLEKERERRQSSADEVKTQVETIAENPQQERKPFVLDYKSPRTFMGIPLVHVTWGFDRETMRTAKGWVAVGPRAVGVAAVGFDAYGVFPFGLAAFGLAPVGAIAVGGAAVGVLAIGLQATGLFAIGEHVTALFNLHSPLFVFLALLASYFAVRFTKYELMGNRLLAAIGDSGVPPVIGGSNAPRGGGAAPDRFWRKFATVIAALIFAPILIGMLGLMAAIAIPAMTKSHKKPMHVVAPVAPSAPTPALPALPAKPGRPTDAHGRKSSPNVARIFTPVIERVIASRDSGTNMFLDLSHRRVLTPPASIVDVIEQNGADKERTWTTRDIPSGARAFQYVQWIRENNIDLMFLAASNDHSNRVITFDCLVTPAHGDTSENWENMDEITPQQLDRAIAAMGWSRAAKQAERKGHPVPRPPVDSGVYNSAIQLDSTNPDGPIVNELTLQQSKLWFFETRTGARGVLEIAEFTNNPASVKIRYKLVQSAPKHAAANVVPAERKTVSFTHPETLMTNDMTTVTVSTETPITEGEHFMALVEMPNGELRTQKFAVATKGAEKSAVITWQFDAKSDGFSSAAAQDAVVQMNANLSKARTLRAGEILPVFAVKNSDGGVVRGSIEYHVHMPQPVPVPAGSMAAIK
jgi:hypothetical protein